MARLFIAIALSEQQKTELGALQQKIKGYLDGVRWVRPEGLHLTLKFLGETDPGRFEAVKAAMEETGSSAGSFVVTYGQSGVFPSPQRARVVWIGLTKGETAVRELAVKLDRALKRRGFKPEKRSFKPHLTIGRIRDTLAREKVQQFIEREGSFETGSSRVEEIILFESKLSPQGASYQVRHRTALPDGESRVE